MDKNENENLQSIYECLVNLTTHMKVLVDTAEHTGDSGLKKEADDIAKDTADKVNNIIESKEPLNDSALISQLILTVKGVEDNHATLLKALNKSAENNAGLRRRLDEIEAAARKDRKVFDKRLKQIEEHLKDSQESLAQIKEGHTALQESVKQLEATTEEHTTSITRITTDLGHVTKVLGIERDHNGIIIPTEDGHLERLMPVRNAGGLSFSRTWMVGALICGLAFTFLACLVSPYTWSGTLRLGLGLVVGSLILSLVSGLWGGTFQGSRAQNETFDDRN